MGCPMRDRGEITLSLSGASIGIVFGSIVWATSYFVLPLVKLYKPIWEYDGKTLAKDLIAYLTFGLGTGAAFRLLSLAAV
jgi:hypothetical protein